MAYVGIHSLLWCSEMGVVLYFVMEEIANEMLTKIFVIFL